MKIIDNRKSTKKFSVSMPAEGYEFFREQSRRAGVSVSQYLYRAGSIVDIEQVVRFPLDNAGVPSEPK